MKIGTKRKLFTFSGPVLAVGPNLCYLPVRVAETGLYGQPRGDGLRAEYEHRKHVYEAAVDALFAKGYQVPDTEYWQLKAAVENAVIDLDVARVKLDSSLPANGGASSRLH